MLVALVLVLVSVVLVLVSVEQALVALSSPWSSPACNCQMIRVRKGKCCHQGSTRHPHIWCCFQGTTRFDPPCTDLMELAWALAGREWVLVVLAWALAARESVLESDPGEKEAQVANNPLSSGTGNMRILLLRKGKWNHRGSRSCQRNQRSILDK